MSIVALSLSQQRMGAAFEKYALDRVTEDRIACALGDLISQETLHEALVLATCERAEIYLAASQFHAPVQEVAKVLATALDLPVDAVDSETEVIFGQGALRHLFRIVSGLESQILGESEILAQVRNAVRRYRERRTVGPVLSRHFDRAFEVGKRVRHETTIAQGNVSITSAAASLARLSDAPTEMRVGVVGSGAIGTEVARVLRDRHATVTLLTTNSERATEIGKSMEGITPGVRSELPSLLDSFDSLVVATSTKEFIVEPHMLEGGRPLRIVDISRPRAVNPAIAEINGVSLIDLEGVNDFVADQLQERSLAISSAEQIIEEELERAKTVSTVQDISDLLSALYDNAETVRLREVARVQKRHSGGDPLHPEELDEVTRRVIAKMLHGPAIALRSHATDEDFQRFAESFRQIFGI